MIYTGNPEEGKTFYEAIWFSDSDIDEPIIRGVNPEEIEKEVLKMTDGDSGCLEVYKITYNNLGYSIELFKKLNVINKLENTTEKLLKE